MVEQMKPGSVVVDLAAETGGNVEGSVAGKVVRIGHAQVWGGDNVPSQMPGPASKLYAQNLVNLLTLMTSEGEFAPDFDDEVVAGSAVTHAGRIVHEPTREAIEGASAPLGRDAASEASDPVGGRAASEASGQSRPPRPDPAQDQQLDLPFDQEADQ
jgi:NAD(P) transhydrogenase subunit alpha